MKSHLLRRESVTPIATYLTRRGELPDSADGQLEFAAVLLDRERESICALRHHRGSGE